MHPLDLFALHFLQDAVGQFQNNSDLWGKGLQKVLYCVKIMLEGILKEVFESFSQKSESAPQIL